MKDKIRKKLCAALVGAMLLGLLSGCGQTETGEEDNNDIQIDESLSGETLTSGAAADNVFSLAVDYEKSLNPITTRSTLNQLVDNLVYDRLFEVDANYNVTSRVLDDWYYSKNEDSRGYWVFRVKDGIMMHDGSTMTAQDVVYSISQVFSSGSKYYQAQMGRVYSSAYQGEIYVSGDYEASLEQAGFTRGDEGWTLPQGDFELRVTAVEEDTAAGMLLTAEVSAYHLEEPLLTLPCVRYFPGEVQP